MFALRKEGRKFPPFDRMVVAPKRERKWGEIQREKRKR